MIVFNQIKTNNVNQIKGRLLSNEPLVFKTGLAIYRVQYLKTYVIVDTKTGFCVSVHHSSINKKLFSCAEHQDLYFLVLHTYLSIKRRTKWRMHYLIK